MQKSLLKITLAFPVVFAQKRGMAVYTHLERDEIEALLAEYDVSALQRVVPIAEGVENSNYLLECEQARYILTIYEKRVETAELPYFLNLKQHLAAKGVPCPVPIARKDGTSLSEVKGRPAALISFLKGKSLSRIQNPHIAALGRGMAQLHLAGKSFPQHRANRLSPDKLLPLYQQSRAQLDQIETGLSDLLAQEMEAMQRWPQLGLPKGVIHADLFPDNVFFQGETLSGLIDFYFACEDYWAYDLAIAFNAWCFEGKVDFNITKAQHLVTHYHRQRPLSDAELDALPFLARGAALRFFLTRAVDWFSPVAGAVVTPKDPMEYVKKWQFHSQAESFRDYVL